MNLDEMRQLCATYWNPIGVPMSNVTTQEALGFRPLPMDEYDAYLAHVIHLIEAGASKAEVRAYLDTVERDYLMLSTPAGDKAKFIEAVFKGDKSAEM